MEFGVPASTNFDDVIGDANCDAVILSTPHSLHEQQVFKAAVARKHIFCEKPLGLTLASARRSIEICQKNKVVLGIGHERRFESPIEELRKIIADGVLGIPLQIEANFSHDKFCSLPTDNWRLDPHEAPAAGLTGPGIHLIDLAISFLGDVESVVAHCATRATKFAGGDTLGALLRHRSGGNSYIAATLATPFISRFAFFGSKGWVEIRDKAHVESPQGWIVQRQTSGKAMEQLEYPVMNATLANLDAFGAAAAGKTKYPISHADILATTAALEGVLRSASSTDSLVRLN